LTFTTSERLGLLSIESSSDREPPTIDKPNSFYLGVTIAAQELGILSRPEKQLKGNNKVILISLGRQKPIILRRLMG
jgi:hypothetical protein